MLFIGFTFSDFLTRKGLPGSTTDLQTLVAEQLMEELGVGGFFSASSCDRANYTAALASGFEIGKYTVLKYVSHCVNRFYFENFRW